jgi:hypothetical protein
MSARASGGQFGPARDGAPEFGRFARFSCSTGVLFAGSRASPDPKKLRLIRIAGVLLIAAATIYLIIKVAAA